MLRRPNAMSVLGFAVLIGVGAGIGACGGGDPPEETSTPASEVTVNLTNWAMEPTSRTLAAGTVRFVVTHEMAHGAAHGEGEEGATHQLIVARLPDGAKAGQNKFGTPLINLGGIKPGEVKTAEATLEPGTYELACQEVEEVSGRSVNHYVKGMYTSVTVR
ncbi:MAG: hypothetical protein ACKVT1_18005 [Dehalococcoidia bacterium]